MTVNQTPMHEIRGESAMGTASIGCNEGCNWTETIAAATKKASAGIIQTRRDTYDRDRFDRDRENGSNAEMVMMETCCHLPT